MTATERSRRRRARLRGEAVPAPPPPKGRQRPQFPDAFLAGLASIDSLLTATPVIQDDGDLAVGSTANTTAKSS